MGLDAFEKDAEKQRLPIIPGMRRDADPRRRRSEQRGIRQCRLGSGRQEVDAGVTGECLGDGEALPVLSRVGAVAMPA